MPTPKHLPMPALHAVQTQRSLTDLPDLTPDLVGALDALFPEQCPSPNMTDRAIWIYAGKRELVRALRTVLATQTARNNIS